MKNIFKFYADIFIQIKEILLGEEFLTAIHRYNTNIDIVSMVVMYVLEFGWKEDFEWVLKGCVKND